MLIRQTEFFHGISERNQRTLASVAVLKTVQKREYLFTEGQKGTAVFVLASGGIQLMKTTAEGREIVIRTVQAGEHFAEVILFERDTFPVSALAVKKSVVLQIAKFDFQQLLKESVFLNDFITMLTRRMRYLTERILYLTSCDVDERFFLFLREHYGEKETYTLSLSKKDIAAAIGASPETFSRLMLRIREEGKGGLKGKVLNLRRGFWAGFP
jgi:CRP/FNR family transcriptional regulator